MGYDLKKLQSTILIIAEEIKRICEKNNINYIIYAGTVLGAVRHGGFIPWDDDMDFAMTRDNYNKFIECCKTDLNKEFLMLNWNEDDEYGNFFLKIMLKGTAAISSGNSTTKYPKGIYIDVFPLDKVPVRLVDRIFQKYRSYFLLHLIWQKENYNWSAVYSGWKKITNNVLNILALPFNREKLIQKCEKMMTRYNCTSSEYYTCICGVYGYDKEMFPREWIDNPQPLEFENSSYMCITHTDEYLSSLYGNYMELPPVEKRRTHSFIKVDFGPY